MPRKKQVEEFVYGSRNHINAIKKGLLPVPVGARLITDKKGRTQLRNFNSKELKELQRIANAYEMTQSVSPPPVPKNKLFTVTYLTAPNRKTESQLTFHIKENYCYFSHPFLKEHRVILSKILDIIKRKRTNAYVMLKLYYVSEDQKSRFSIVFDRNEVNLEYMMKVLKYKMENNAYGESGQDSILIDITVNIRPLSNQGGCDTRRHKITRRFSNVNLISPKSKGNNCLFMCYIERLELSGVKFKPDNIRKKLGIEINSLIHIEKVPQINSYFEQATSKKIQFKVYNELHEVIKSNDTEGVLIELHEVIKSNDTEGVLIEIHLENEHYYLIERTTTTKTTKKKICPDCKRLILESNVGHVCNINSIKKTNAMGITNTRVVVPRHMRNFKVKLDYDKDYIYFTIKTTLLDKKIIADYVEYTQNNIKIICSLSLFVHRLKQNERFVYLVSYGGSNVDFYLLLQQLINQKVKIKHFIQNGNNIFSITTEFFRAFDLNLFLSGSYEKVLKQFNVKSLKELYVTLNDIYYSQDQINLCDFITISDTSYSLWTNSLARSKTKVELLKDWKTFRFVGDSIYAGRCMVLRSSFKSAFYNKIASKEITYQQTFLMGDFCVYLDVKSLFPAGCVGTENIKIRFPVGFGRWSENGKEEYDKGTLGFYSITYTPPRNKRIAVLPRKNVHNVIYDLRSSSGVYTSEDIANALRHNYKITFNGICYVYDNTSEILFKEFVGKYFRLKESTKCEPVRQVSKITINGLIGKLSEKPIEHESRIVNDDDELDAFINLHSKCDWDVGSSFPKIISGELLDQNAEKCIKRPVQLGAFVYAYSRSIMLSIFEAITPDLTEAPCYYSDTDSLFVSSKNYFKLKQKGFIKNEIGYLSNELEKKDIPFPIVINAKFFCKKKYFMEYMDANGILYIGDDAKTVASGIPKEQLTYNKLVNNEEISFKSLKKTSNFDVFETEITKSLNTSSAMPTVRSAGEHTEITNDIFINGEWFPDNYSN